MADQTIPTIKNLRGNIGIGTASPSYKLEVDGGDFLVNTTNGGYVQVDESDNSLKLSDGVAIKFGTGNDFQISHTGTNTTLYDGGTGALVVATNQFKLLSANQSETLIQATEDSSVDIYHNNSKKFETTADGATITGSLTVSSDLIINGTTTTIDTTNLLVEDKNIVIGNVDTPSDTTADGGGITLKGASDYTIAWSNSTDYWTFNQGIEIDVGSTNAKGIKIGNDSYDASIIPTSLGGVAVSSSDNFLFYLNGAVRATFTTDGKLNLPDSGEITLGAGNDLKLYHNGTNSYLKNTTGDLYIKTEVNDGDIRFESDDGSGNEAEYFRLDGGDVRTIFSKDVRFLDNVEVGVGTNKALAFEYNGANSYISNLYGDLYIDQHNDNADIRFNCDNGSGGITEYFRIDGGANQNVFPVSVLLNDGVYLHIGTGSDLQLYHDATNSNITNNTGDLVILNTADDKDILLRADDGSGGNATYIQLDGSVTRNKLLQHTSLPDGKNLILGTGDDLQLYHNGSDSYIFNYTGSLYIKNEQDDGDIIFQCDNNSGGVETYFYLDGSINSADAHTVFPDSSRIILGSGTDTQIYHDGSNSYISHTGTGDLYIQNSQDDRDIIFQSDDGSGGTETYFFLDGSHNTAGAPWTVFPDQSYLAFGDSKDMSLQHNGSRGAIDNFTGALYIRQYANDNDIIFQCDDGSGGVETYFFLDGSASSGNPIIRFPDNSIITLGTDNDCYLYHNGTDTRFQNNTGDLLIQNAADDKDIVFSCEDGSGGNETYFFLDGSKSTGDPYTIFPNNSFLGFGDAGNLLIRHTGLGASIQNNGGDIDITQNTNDGDIRFYCDDGSGGTAEYFRVDGGATDVFFTKNIRLADSTRLELGAGSDTKFYHDGTNSYITNYTGSLDISNASNDEDILFKCDDGSGGLATYFYLDGSLADGTYLNTRFADNSRILFGTGGDFVLNHDGTNSYIDNETGDLYIRAKGDDKDIVFQSDNGSGGIDTYMTINGGDHRTHFYKQTRHYDNIAAKFGASDDLSIYHDGTDSYISNNTGSLIIQNNLDNGDIVFKSDDGSGGVETYFFLDGSSSGGDPYTRFPDNSYLVFGDSGDLQIRHDGTNSSIKNETGNLTIVQNADDKDIVFKCDNGSGGTETYFYLDGSASSGDPFTVFPDNSQIAFGDSRDLRIDHNGTDSFIQNYVGNLVIRNYADDKDIEFHCDNGSGGTETYFFLDGSVSSGNPYTTFPDNSRLTFGTSRDLQIVHDGTNTYVENLTGNLNIINYANDKDIAFQSDDGSGGVETYFFLDGSASSGEPYTVFPDSSRLRFGTGLDLDIHHDGSNSYISQTGTGHLYIQQTVDGADMIFKNDDGSGGLHEYMRLDGGMYHVVFSKSTQHADGAYGKFGNGGDLQLSHNGTNSFIKNTNGDLYIENSADDKDIIFKTDDGSGGTETYFYLDGSASSGDPYTKFPDNSILGIGDSADLKIFHNATNTFIENNTGDLFIKNGANDKDILFQCDDGSGGTETYFYLDGSVSSGNPFTVFPDNSRLSFGTNLDLRFVHDGSNSYISQTGTGDLYIQNGVNDKDIVFQSDDGSGGIETYFYLDGSVSSGNPVTKFPDNSILALGTSGDFYHYHDGTDSYHANFTGDFYIDNNANDKDVILRSDDGSGGVTAYITLDGSATDIKFSKNVDASSQNIVAYYLEGTYKSFLIDHPTQEGKKLRHGCLEGPEHGVYFRGKSSDSVIECPEYWMGLVEEDSVTVQLTAIGPNQNIYVDHIDEDGNIHVGSNTDEPLNYYYTVNGERKGDKVVVVEDA
jgi:hypothetical protein